MQILSPQELANALHEDPDGQVILDVRETAEVAWCHIAGSIHIPMGEISTRLNELDRNRKTIVLCHHGMRSAAVVGFLESCGFEKVYNLRGGIDAWSIEVDPSIKRY